MIKSRPTKEGYIPLDENGVHIIESLLSEQLQQMKGLQHLSLAGMGLMNKVAFMSDQKQDELIASLETIIKVLNAARL